MRRGRKREVEGGATEKKERGEREMRKNEQRRRGKEDQSLLQEGEKCEMNVIRERTMKGRNER